MTSEEVPPAYTGLKRMIHATRYSWQGLRAAWIGEDAFRQECVLALLLVPAFVFADLSHIDRVFLVLTTGLVLIVELLNSAVEAVVDRVGAEYHALSGQAKDMSSAAVSVSLLLWLYVWIEVLFFAA